MFRFNAFEKSVIGVVHIQWLSVVYSILPYLLIVWFHGTEKLVLIGTIDIIWFLTILPARHINDGFLYSKTPEVGTKLFNRIAVLLFLLANIFLPLDLPMRVALISSLCCTNYYWNDKWGYIYATKKQAFADIIYVPFYTVFVVWPIVFNPLGNIYWSFYIITSFSDVIWLIFKSVYLKPAIKDTYFGKIDLKLEWKGLKDATKRAAGDLISDSMLYIGKLFIMSASSVNLFASALYLLVSNLPTFKLSRVMVGQMKKAVLKDIEFNPKRLINSILALIIFEMFPIILVMGTFFINVEFQINSFIIFTITYFMALFVETYANTFKMLMLFRGEEKIVALMGFIFALVSMVYRIVLKDPTYIYLTHIVVYSIISMVYWHIMNKESLKTLVYQS